MLDALDSWQSLAALAISTGLATIRIAVAMLVVPVFSNEIIPALVRNSLFTALALVVALTQPLDLDLTASATGWLLLVAKEAFLGFAIGAFFGAWLWAFSAAGELIDNQIGTSIAQVFDPVAGHEVTVFGELYSRLANYAFMAAGGLMLLVGTLFKSYAIWPVDAALPRLEGDASALLIDTLAEVFTLAIVLAAPLLVVMFLIDLGMGLINRFAERLNVFFLSNSIKSLVAVLLVLMALPLLLALLVELLERHADETLELLRVLLSGGG